MYVPALNKELLGISSERISLEDICPTVVWGNEAPHEVTWDSKKIDNLKILHNSIEEEGLLNPLIGFLVPEDKKKFCGEMFSEHRSSMKNFGHKEQWQRYINRPYWVKCGNERLYILHLMGATETDMIIVRDCHQWNLVQELEKKCLEWRT